MKSLLVDVLRQAGKNYPEQTLSDSGSFDTTQKEIPETANDSVIEELGDDSEALKLYETSASLDATFSDPDDDTGFLHADELTLDDASDGPVTERIKPAPRAPVAVVESNGPVLARLAPLACISLAAFAAMSWFAYQQLKIRYAESEFATAQMSNVGARDSSLDDGVGRAAVERFPFIGAEPATSDSEDAE